jgi:hypothetical protein
LSEIVTFRSHTFRGRAIAAKHHATPGNCVNAN